MTIWVGTSGWSYPHWEGVLYPPGTPRWHRLGHYLPHFATAELNSSFYRWPSDAAFANWQARLPAGFCLSVKAPRGLTHARRLYGPKPWLARMARGLARLGPRLGVVLVQLPPDLARDDARLSYFLQHVPPGLRLALEFRHPSWHTEAVFAMLEQHGAAYCVMSGARLPCVLRATAPFVYVRLHGPSPDWLYAGSYADADLDWWAARCREWAAQGRDVYAYFNNDGEGHAVRNAWGLKARLS